MIDAMRKRLDRLEARAKPETVWISGGCGCADCLAVGDRQLERRGPQPAGTAILRLVTGIHRDPGTGGTP